MHALADTKTPFHIDLDWWRRNERNLGRFLAEILGEEEPELPADSAIDYIDPHTAEVQQLDPLWVKVLVQRAHQPDFITSATPLTSAVLRAFIENRNQPMTPTQLHKRINRTSPETVLRVLKTAQRSYGIFPVEEG
jgi:hypothetical protein